MLMTLLCRNFWIKISYFYHSSRK